MGAWCIWSEGGCEAAKAGWYKTPAILTPVNNQIKYKAYGDST